MTHHFVFDNLRSGYVQLTDYTARNGVQLDESHGLELGNVVIQLDDIYSTLPLGVGRKWNLKLAAVRALTLLGGVSRPELEVAAAPALENYLVNGGFQGCPGNLIGYQTVDVLQEFSNDLNTKNAVVSIMDGGTIRRAHFGDHNFMLPRILDFGFNVRNGNLDMSATLRTADLWLELVYDIFSLTQVQHSVARFLGLPPGSFTANVWSLTLQEKHVPLCVTLHEPNTPWVFQPSGVHVNRSEAHPSALRDIVDSAHELLDFPDRMRQLDDEQESELWYQRHMLRVHRLLDNND